MPYKADDFMEVFNSQASGESTLQPGQSTTFHTERAALVGLHISNLSQTNEATWFWTCPGAKPEDSAQGDLRPLDHYSHVQTSGGGKLTFANLTDPIRGGGAEIRVSLHRLD